jgi:opacity protein-like surface antigen
MSKLVRSSVWTIYAAVTLAVGTTSVSAQSSFDQKAFQGPYIGVSPLYAWAKSDVTLSRPGFASVSGSKNLNGPAIGAFAGYDWRIGNGGVLGVVGDLGVAKFSDTKAAPVGTLRARLGQTIAPDVLLYATGGRAFAQQTLSGTLGGVAYDVSKTVGGWTYGGGLEKQTAIGSQPVRFGLEVLRNDLSKFEFDAGTRHVAISNAVWTVGARAAIALK